MPQFTVDQLVSAVKKEGGFDSSSASLSDSDVLSWINDAYTEAMVEARWLKGLVSLGVTVTGQGDYVLPENVADLRSLVVGSSEPWTRVGAQDMLVLRAGVGRIVGGPGAFAPGFEADGDAVVSLWPPPERDGDAISGEGVLIPSELESGGAASTVKVPRDLQRAILVHGAVHEGKSLVAEDAPGADWHRARWQAAVNKLKARANSRVGHGPHQIRIG
jgi:hypothetical protein